jgi:cobalt transport protein ATP-binding subunit
MNTVPALEILGLRYRYPDGAPALDGINLAINEGEKVGIIGANGAGKTTLLLHFNGILRGEGAVRVFGQAVATGTLACIRRQVGLVFQNPDDQLFCSTVFDDVAFGPRNMKLSEEEVRARVAAALQAVGLENVGHKSAYHLSCGQRKRAAIATVLSMQPRLFVLDEPTSNLDPRGRRDLTALLNGLNGPQVLATHDLELVRHCCNRVVVMRQGKLVADAPTAEIVDDAALLEAHGL